MRREFRDLMSEAFVQLGHTALFSTPFQCEIRNKSVNFGKIMFEKMDTDISRGIKETMLEELLS